MIDFMVVVLHIAGQVAQQIKVDIFVIANPLAAALAVIPVFNGIQRSNEFGINAGFFAHLAQRSLFWLFTGSD